MKKLFTLLLLAVIVSFAIDLSAQTGQDWKWLNPAPQGNTLRYVKAWDLTNWYAIGYAGTFMKTTNAGTNWTFHHKAGGQYLAYTGQSINMYDAHFINQNTGIVVGSSSVNGGIVRTTNGGTTFDTISGLPVTGIFYQVQFLNTTTGYAVGTTVPKIYVTTNAGVSWTGLATAPTTTLYDIYAFDANTLIISTTLGNVQKSTDAGATWSAVIPTGTTTVGNKLHFVDANTGYIAGATGKFGFTTDGGATWTSKTVTVGATTNTSAYYDIAVASSKVFLTGDPNYIFKTENNGTTWDTVGFTAVDGSQPWTSTYYSTSLSVTGDTLVTVGAFGLINVRVNASGRRVFTTLKKAGISYDIWAQNSSAAGLILAVGARSSALAAADQVLRSTNGGASWNLATFPATAFGFLNSIHMIDNNTGWACGSVASLFKTTNGGASWDS
ncbi:MAG: YCF48-related protein, partial [Ignavibacteriae bacterium]|nr:YCF48-related protein [Ignavibacteriota bacterium]